MLSSTNFCISCLEFLSQLFQHHRYVIFRQVYNYLQTTYDQWQRVMPIERDEATGLRDGSPQRGSGTEPRYGVQWQRVMPIERDDATGLRDGSPQRGSGTEPRYGV